MAQSFSLGTLGNIINVNAAANSVSFNIVSFGNSSVYTTANSTSFSGTANNTLYVGSVSAANVVSNAQLSANLANYQTTAGMSAYQTTAGMTAYQTVAGMSNYQTTAGMSAYQTTAGLSANVATLTANNANNLGGTAAANFIANTAGGLTQNTSGHFIVANTGIIVNTNGVFVNAAYINTISANASTYLNGKTESNLNVNNALTSNNSSYLNGVAGSNYALLSGANFIGAVTVSNNLTVTGNLTLSGNTVIVGANNLVVQDAVMSLHTLANLAPWTSNDGKLIGMAYHYYDTSDKQALLAINQSNTFLTYYNTSTDAALGDPTGTTLGTIQASTFYAGNSSVYATVNATTYTGTSNNATNLGGVAASGYQTTAGLSANVAILTANNASYLGGVAAASYVNTSGAYTISGIHTHSANLVMSTTAGISANGGYGTAGQVLTSNGTTVYWSTVSGGGGSPGGSNTYVQFNNSGAFGGNANFTFSTSTNILYVANSIGVGVGLSSPAATIHANGSIFATGDMVSAYSDIRLKNVSGPVLNALEKVSQIETFYYTPNKMALSIGADSEMKSRIGVSAQKMQEILPEVVHNSPLGQGYLTVQYERIVPLLIEAIKELKEEIRVLKETK